MKTVTNFVTESISLFFQGSFHVYPLPSDPNLPFPPRILKNLPPSEPVECLIRVYIIKVRPSHVFIDPLHLFSNACIFFIQLFQCRCILQTVDVRLSPTIRGNIVRDGLTGQKWSLLYVLHLHSKYITIRYYCYLSRIRCLSQSSFSPYSIVQGIHSFIYWAQSCRGWGDTLEELLVPALLNLRGVVVIFKGFVIYFR